jgi:hypothetical protein
MSIFSSILQKLGIQKPPAAPTTPARPAQNVAKGPGPSYPYSTAGGAPFPGKPAAMPMVDVVSKLDGLAKASPIKLNWKQSINDLMALLGLDHSPAAIKELAVELGCPESEMGDSYKRNVWTHKALLQKIAENGGNIPQNLLH